MSCSDHGNSKRDGADNAMSYFESCSDHGNSKSDGADR